MILTFWSVDPGYKNRRFTERETTFHRLFSSGYYAGTLARRHLASCGIRGSRDRPAQYQRAIDPCGAAADAPRMTKRIVSVFLWFYVTLVIWNALAYMTGLSILFGPVAATAAMRAVTVVPMLAPSTTG